MSLKCNIYIKISLYCAFHCAFAAVGSESMNTASLGRWIETSTGYDRVSWKIWPEEGTQVKL